LGRGDRRPRVLRSAHEADAPRGNGKGHAPRSEQPARKSRGADERKEQSRGTPVAERPNDANRGRGKRPAARNEDKASSGKPAPAKRRGPPTKEGQRPGSGRD